MRVALTIAAGLASFVVEAGELCVSCTGPDVTYRCEVEGVATTGGRDMGAQLLCITELAKLERHQSCSVARAGSGPCQGELKVVKRNLAEPLGKTGPSAFDDTTPDAPPQETSPVVPAEAKQGEGTSSESAEPASATISDAGTAMGEAAKKTWTCFTSFLTDC